MGHLECSQSPFFVVFYRPAVRFMSRVGTSKSMGSALNSTVCASVSSLQNACTSSSSFSVLRFSSFDSSTTSSYLLQDTDFGLHLQTISHKLRLPAGWKNFASFAILRRGRFEVYIAVLDRWNGIETSGVLVVLSPYVVEFHFHLVLGSFTFDVGHI